MEDEQENQSRPMKNDEIVSGKENLLIKLKIPKLMNKGGAMDHDDGVDVNRTEYQNPRRVCDECGKEFSSGKALGGHMRIHSEARKLQQQYELKSNHGQITKFKKIHAQHVSCSVCAKNFPSMKSLFGHMRCHPDREWRGIQPPPRQSETNIFDNYDLEGGGGGGSAAAVQSLPGWSVKARRGSKAVIEASASSGVSGNSEEEDEDEKLRKAVHDLLLLANQYDSFESSGVTHDAVQKPREFDDHEATNSNEIDQGANRGFHKRKRCLIEEDERRDYCPAVENRLRIKETEGRKSTCVGKREVMDKGKGKSVDVVGENAALGRDDFLADEQVDYSDVKNYVNEKIDDDDVDNKKVKKMKLMDHVKGSSTKDVMDKYKCSICDKSFPSHQALGGHRSSHNKFKITIIDVGPKTDHHQSSSSVAAYNHHHHTNDNISQIDETTDLVNLGAAQAQPQQLRTPTSQVTLLHEEACPQTQTLRHRGRGFLAIDLNEPPPMEDNDYPEHAATGF